jgi:uncharacterized protein (TIGR03000 family)
MNLRGLAERGNEHGMFASGSRYSSSPVERTAMSGCKRFWFMAAIGLTAASIYVSDTYAQKGGGGRGGAGPSMSGRGPGGPSGGQSRGSPGWSGDWNRGRGGWYGWYGWGWEGWPNGYTNGYADWYYRPWYWDDDAPFRRQYAVVQPVIIASPTSARPSPSDPGGTAVRINVRVPADAEVWVEGAKTAQTGTRRTYVSPPLDPDETYTYSVRARWRGADGEVDRTRKAQVSGGDEVTLNFVGTGRPVEPLLPPPTPIR